MIIAVLDDGICKNEILAPVETYCIGKERKEDFIQRDCESHATVCAKIIEKYCTPDKFIDIAFLGENGAANIIDLCLALELCFTLEVDVINLSNGIENYNEESEEYQRLLSICKKISDKGVKIYAAQSNRGRQTIPANFPCTISVEQIERKQNILYSLYRRSDIYANGKHTIYINGKKYKTIKCNSYACAYAVSQMKKTKSNIFRGIVFSDMITSNPLFYEIPEWTMGQAADSYELYDKEKKLIGKIYMKKVSALEKRTLNREKNKFLSIEISQHKKRIIIKNSQFYPMDIPVIYIKSGEDAIGFVKAICSSFLEKGYNAAILSTNKYDFLEGICYVPKDCISSYMKFFAFYNKNDILFVINEDNQEKGVDDVAIEIQGDEIRVMFQEESLVLQNNNKVVDSIISFYGTEDE